MISRLARPTFVAAAPPWPWRRYRRCERSACGIGPGADPRQRTPPGQVRQCGGFEVILGRRSGPRVMSPRSMGAPRSSPVGGPIPSVRCGLVTTGPSGLSLTSSRPTTLGLSAECFEELGGVPRLVLADRMACPESDVVANVVVPAANYVRSASHYGSRPDFCHAADPEYQGMVVNLVGHAKDDLLVPLEPDDDPSADGCAGLDQRAGTWGVEIGSRWHSETHAVSIERLDSDRDYSVRCDRCDPKWVRRRSRRRSTSSRASGSGRSATRSRTG